MRAGVWSRIKSMKWIRVSFRVWNRVRYRESIKVSVF